MSRPRAVLLCPGRGSYGRQELGFLKDHLRPGPVAEALQAADAQRPEGQGLLQLDAAERFRPGQHLQGVNAAELIYFGSMLHIEELRQRYEILAVGGNSLGWYTALAAAGALSPEEGQRLVRGMAELQLEAAGAQLLTTLVDEDWRPDPEAEAELAAAVSATRELGADHFVADSIRLGGHRVLGGTGSGIQQLQKHLQKRRLGDREFPFVLAGNGPFHTSLCQPIADSARARLAGLRIRRPELHLIDGLGQVHSPWSAHPQELLAYTLGQQVTETFDFSATVRTAIREFCPDLLLCAGPGTSLRAPVGHVVLAEGYRGVQSRADLLGRNPALTTTG